MSTAEAAAESFPDKKDCKILQNLQSATPAIPDDVCRYFLNRAGCATEDKTMVKLASTVVQIALEKVLDDARTIATANRVDETANSFAGSSADELATEELDLQSLCDSFVKNGEVFMAPNLDVFLDEARMTAATSQEQQQSSKQRQCADEKE
eukprot:GHVS01021582.1.p2 GENE.GHVS01021582.1~~GHVS01021582.1.p2  ORF type:complete len:152 (-),score=30.94 GHVS01021582.1:336-791(-)